MMSFTYSGEDGEGDIPKNVEQLLIAPSVQILAAEVCQARPQLQHVDFPADGQLKTIGNYAFASCSSLLKIQAPSSLVTIGNGSFLGCNSLVEMELMSNDDGNDGCLISIGRAAFNQCRSLIKVMIPSTVTIIETGAFENCRGLVEVVIHKGGLTTIGKGAFASCFSLTKILLPSTIQTLGSRAFANCKALTEIHLPDELNEIAESLCCDCSSLKRVTLGAGVKSIGQNAFFHCNALIEIDLPEGLEYIGDDAFRNCTALQRIKVASTVKIIGIRAFSDCYSLTEMLLPDGLSKAGVDVFWSCQSLERIRFPSTMNVIGASALWKCTSLVEVELFEGLKVIAHFAFHGCTSLRKIGFPATLEEIGNYSFSDCVNLIEVRLEEGLKTIGVCAFKGADSLAAISIPSTVEMISALSFSKCGHLTTVELTQGMEATISDSSFALCYSLVNIEWPHKCSVSKLALKNSLWEFHNISAGNNAVTGVSLRFQGYPIHKLCYHASSTTLDSFYLEVRSSLHKNSSNTTGNKVSPLAWLSNFVQQRFGLGTAAVTTTFPPLERRNHLESNLVDRFGMTPFHVLGSAAQSRPDLWQILLDSPYPLHLMLDQVDMCERRPLEYLILCGIWTSERRLMMKMALEKWMIDRVANWGATAWQLEMEAKVHLVLGYMENERDTTLRLRRLKEAYNTIKRYEFLEGVSVLELALWKNEMASLSVQDSAAGFNAMMTDAVDSRSACRSKSGVSFAVPMILSFLKVQAVSS